MYHLAFISIVSHFFTLLSATNQVSTLADMLDLLLPSCQHALTVATWLEPSSTPKSLCEETCSTNNRVAAMALHNDQWHTETSLAVRFAAYASLHSPPDSCIVSFAFKILPASINIYLFFLFFFFFCFDSANSSTLLLRISFRTVTASTLSLSQTTLQCLQPRPPRFKLSSTLEPTYPAPHLLSQSDVLRTPMPSAHPPRRSVCQPGLPTPVNHPAPDLALTSLLPPLTLKCKPYDTSQTFILLRLR